MSLPWRYATAIEYVAGTIRDIRAGSPEFSHLNVGKCYLHGPDLELAHMKEIFQVARGSEKIFSISLSGVEITGEAFSSLAELLRTRDWKRIVFNCCSGEGILSLDAPVLVHHLQINSCHLSPIDFLALGDTLTRNTKLVQLDLFEEEIIGAHASSIQQGLAVTKSLKVLELSYCRFDSEGVVSLSRGLSDNQSLESLYLPGCELEDQQIVELVRGISKHPKLQHFKAFRNHCGTDGALAFASLLSSSSDATSDDKPSCAIISTFDLSYQQFERAKRLDIGILASGLSRNKSLLTLNLSFNKLNDSDAQLLSEGLRDNKVIKVLDLRANNIRDVGAVAVAENLVSHSSLQKLFLYGNPFGETGANALMKAIRGNTDMEVLNMDMHFFAYETIQFITQLNKAGRRLLKANGLNSAIWPLVLERARLISMKSSGICSEADLILHLVPGPLLLLS